MNELQSLPHISRIQTHRAGRYLLAQLSSEGMNRLHKVSAEALYYRHRVSNSEDVSAL